MPKKSAKQPVQIQGIDAILGSTTVESVVEPPTHEVNLSSIHTSKKQPRRYFDPEKLKQLAISIKEHGIIEPLLVRSLHDDEYELVAGERRYRAAQTIGLETVPVVIRELTDNEAFQLALEENLQREDLNPVEETQGILDLLALKLEKQQDEILEILKESANAAKSQREPNNVIREDLEIIKIVLNSLGKGNPVSFYNNRIPILNLPGGVLKKLREGTLDYTKAKEIAKVKDEEARSSLLEDAIVQSLPLTKIQERVKALRPLRKMTEGLQSRFDNTIKRAKKAKLWDNPKHSKKLERLLEQMDKLLAEAEEE